MAAGMTDPALATVDDATPGALRSRDLLLVLAALALSLALVWLVSREPLVAAGFGAGALALGCFAYVLARRAPSAAEPQWAIPDWTVTVAAIESADRAVAVIDRAGRLVCANSLYESWFGLSNPPPQLAVEAGEVEALARTSRAAWRDGRAVLDRFAVPGRSWRAEVRRTGRGEDFLVWHIAELAAPDPVADLAAALAGRLGRVLGDAGIAAAIVDPDGRLLAASAGFALRATGDAQAALAGQEFVSFLHQDDHDRISWAREGRDGLPLTLYYVPVADGEGAQPGDPAHAPSLLLLADTGIGIGGAVSEGPGRARCPISRPCWPSCRWAWPWPTATGGCCSPMPPSCVRPGWRAASRRRSRPIWWCARTRAPCPMRCAAMPRARRVRATSRCG